MVINLFARISPNVRVFTTPHHLKSRRAAAMRLGGADVSAEYAPLQLKFRSEFTTNFLRTEAACPPMREQIVI